MRLSIVLVHYHTPALLERSVSALRRDLAGAEAEWLVVDNGSTADGRERIAALGLPVAERPDNPGYAAAVNLGAERTGGDVLLVLNPDVLVEQGCTRALLGALEGGAGVAGPRFTWDQGGRLLLPPLERLGLLDELRAVVGRHGRPGARHARARWRRHARRHWRAEAPLRSYSLSGALLAIRRDAWRRVGPFDAGFRLYFEEADWLARARRAGVEAFHVPAARAVHLYDQSAGRSEQAEEWFGASWERYRRRHHGRLAAGVLGALDRRLPRGARGPEVAPAARTVELPAPEAVPGELWLEVSPSAGRFPAAAERLARQERPAAWSLPAEVDRRLPAGALWVTMVDDAGRELGHRRVACGGNGAQGAGRERGSPCA